jgi:Predicted nucleotide-binding protein containing TIR-like domain
MRKEILVITEETVAEDGITWTGGGQIVLSAPASADATWLRLKDTKTQLDAWIEAEKQTKDIFLAFSSKARTTANDIQTFLTSHGVSIHNWEHDFSPGPTIMDELLDASKSCLGAIMLLTKG